MIYDHNCTHCPLSASEYVHTICMEGSGRGTNGGMIVGEAPGRHEDEQGVPFVGDSGKYLNEVLSTVLDTPYARAQTFVTNAVKCRPPANRTPSVYEIRQCRDYYLEAEVAKVDPIAILAMGNPAAWALLGRIGVSDLRNHWWIKRDRFIRVTWHPAYVLRQGRKSETAREFLHDVQAWASRLNEGRADATVSDG